MYKAKVVGFLLYLLLAEATAGLCQVSTTDLKVKAGSNDFYGHYVSDEIDLKENGYIFKTAAPLLPLKQLTTVYYYDQNMELKWKKEVASSCFPNKTQGRLDKLLAAGDGSVIYNVQGKGNKTSALQITQAGDEKYQDLSKYGLTKNLQSVFCDAQNLYYLTTQNGNEKLPAKKAEEKLILHSFSNKEFTYQYAQLALPAIEKGENSSFWSYLGQNATHKFIASKSIDPKTGQCSVQLIGFTSLGKIEQHTKIDFTYPEKKLVYLSPIEKTSSNLCNLVDLDFTESSSKQHPHPFISHTAYSALYLDADHQALYIVGEADIDKRTNVYIHKYSLAGKLIWKGVYSAAEFHKFNLQVRDDESLAFSYYNKEGIAVHEISKTGEQTSFQDLNFQMSENRGYDVAAVVGKYITGTINGKPSQAMQFINTLAPKEKSRNIFSHYVSSKGELLLMSDRKGLVRILRF